MKKTTKISLIITVLLIVTVALSFTKCVTVTHYPSGGGWSAGAWDNKAEVYTEQYSPVFVLIMTGVELGLLWMGNTLINTIIRILLNIAATAGPLGSILLKFTREWMSNLFDYIKAPQYNKIAFSWPVYIIIILGVIISVLHIILLKAAKKPLKNDATGDSIGEALEYFKSADRRTNGESVDCEEAGQTEQL